MQQVRLSAPAPPRSSESASVRSPICAAWSSASTSSGRARASRRCGLSASGLITSATKSRTVSRICNCSALKRRSYMWLLRKLTGLDTTSLALDARGLDHARPFLQILADELAETIGAERKRRDLLLGELLDHLRVMHDRERLLGEPLHDLLRRPRRRYDADPRRHFESRHRLGGRQSNFGCFRNALDCPHKPLFVQHNYSVQPIQNRLPDTSMHGKFQCKPLIYSKFLEPPCDTSRGPCPRCAKFRPFRRGDSTWAMAFSSRLPPQAALGCTVTPSRVRTG